MCGGVPFFSKERGTRCLFFLCWVCACARDSLGGFIPAKATNCFAFLKREKSPISAKMTTAAYWPIPGDACEQLHLAQKVRSALCCFKNLALYLICCTLYLYQHLSKQSNKRFERAALDLKLHGLFCYIKQMVRFLHCIGGFCISSSRKCNGFCNIQCGLRRISPPAQGSGQEQPRQTLYASWKRPCGTQENPDPAAQSAYWRILPAQR